MTYENPFMKQLIDDYACVEDMQWFEYETMHRYIGLSGKDPRNARKVCSPVPFMPDVTPPGRTTFSIYGTKKVKSSSSALYGLLVYSNTAPHHNHQ